MGSKIPSEYRSEDRQSESTDRPLSVYLIAATLAFGAGTAVVLFLGAGIMGLLPGAAKIFFGLLVGVLFLVGLGVFSALPFGLMRDVDRVQGTTDEWVPDRNEQVKRGAAAAGAFLLVTFVGAALTDFFSGAFYGIVVGCLVGGYVAVGYLRERREHVGLS